MKPIENSQGIHLDITNVCHLKCINCTRFIAHLRKDQRKSMTMEQIRTAFDSLEGWHDHMPASPVTGKPPWIGIMGGEPSLHPQFEEFLYEVRARFPKRATFGERGAVGLWSTGTTPQFKKYQKLIYEVFGFVILNPHDDYQQETCEHQPISVAIDEVVDDLEMREFLISHCWVQRQWCPTINHFGAYFCEVAAASDALLGEGKRAWPVVPGWWKKIPGVDGKYGEQSELCYKCSMPIPMDRDRLKTEVTKISPNLLKTFRDLGLKGVDADQVQEVDKKVTNEFILEKYKRWYPGNYHGDFFPDEANQLPPTDLGIHPEDHDELVRIAKKLPKVVDGKVAVPDKEW